MQIRKDCTVLSILLILGVWSNQALGNDFTKSLNELRGNQKQVKKFVYALMQRQLYDQVREVFREQGFREDQIKVVLGGFEFQSFVQNVLQNDKVRQTVDTLLTQILKPGFLEGEVNKRRKEFEERRRQEIFLALSNLRKSRPWALGNSPKKPNSPFFAQLWDRVLEGINE